MYTRPVRYTHSRSAHGNLPDAGRAPEIHIPDNEYLVLEGAWLVERAFASSLEMIEILCVPARKAWAVALMERQPSSGYERAPTLLVLSEGELSDRIGYAFHRGVLATARRPAGMKVDDILAQSVSEECTILVLPETLDPENLGACFRNAAAFGCSALLIGPNCPDPFSRRILRVSMGAVLSLPWARMSSPDDLGRFGEEGVSVAACVLDDGANDIRCWDPPSRLALLLGNEAFGLSSSWLASCDSRLTLPMASGVDSLNVATAGAVFLYALSQRRIRCMAQTASVHD